MFIDDGLDLHGTLVNFPAQRIELTDKSGHQELGWFEDGFVIGKRNRGLNKLKPLINDGGTAGTVGGIEVPDGIRFGATQCREGSATW